MIRGHPRLSVMSQFDTTHTISFSSLIETMSLSCTNFRDTASYLLKFANFDLPQMHLVPPLGVTPVEFRKDFWHHKTSPRAVERRCLRVPMFGHFSRTPTCDRHRQTDPRPWHIPCQSIARAVIIYGLSNGTNRSDVECP